MTKTESERRRRLGRLRRIVYAGMLLGGPVACHEYRPVVAPVNTVTPVRVRLATPRNVVLRRERPDSVIENVRAIEGTLVLLESDSMRIEVMRTESNGRWRDIAAPAEAMIPIRPGTVVERRTISRSRTLLLILGAWVVVGAAVIASL